MERSKDIIATLRLHTVDSHLEEMQHARHNQQAHRRQHPRRRRHQPTSVDHTGQNVIRTDGSGHPFAQQMLLRCLCLYLLQRFWRHINFVVPPESWQLVHLTGKLAVGELSDEVVRAVCSCGMTERS